MGRVTKKRVNLLELLHLRRNKLRKNIGYIVKVRPVLGDIPEYRLVRSRQGDWLGKQDCEWVREGDGSMIQTIKTAIEEFEKSSMLS